MSAQWRLVSPGYFRTMGIPVLQGRDLRPEEIYDEPTGGNVVVSEELARRYWPGEDAVGRQFRPWARTNAPVTIVGVVGNVRVFGLEAALDPMVYLNFANSGWPMQVALRTQGDPRAQGSALRTAVREIDRNLPVAFIRPMDELLDSSLAPRRFNLLLLGVFAGLGLVLAAVGLYGVMSYLVSQRIHEIGIRLALGAQRRDIFRLVAGRGIRLTLVGIALGLAGALGLTKFMVTMLFGVKPNDLTTFVGVALLLALVATLACWVPARRATRVDPIITLRYE
jgi:putative ABC transport system permease protein